MTDVLNFFFTLVAILGATYCFRQGWWLLGAFNVFNAVVLVIMETVRLIENSCGS